METLVFKKGRVDLFQIPEPNCPENGAIFKVMVTGICRSDLKLLERSRISSTPQFIPGHESFGKVVQSRSSLAKEGETYVISPWVTCQTCQFCLSDQANLCPDSKVIGFSRNGTMGNFLPLERSDLERGVLIPSQGLKPEAAVFAEPVTTIVDGIRRAKPEAGETVLILGAGTMGRLAAVILNACGANVAMVDIDPVRADCDRGWKGKIHYSTEDEEMETLRSFFPSGFDLVWIACSTPSAQVISTQLAKPGGRVMFFAGLASDNRTAAINLDDIHYRGITLIGTHGARRSSFERGLAFQKAGVIPWKELITGTFSFKDAPKAFKKAFQPSHLKVLLKMESGIK